MGLFSSKYKTTVGTSVVRVIEDDNLPNSIKSSLLESLIANTDIADSLISNISQSLGVRTERMYDYARAKYTHGLPSGQIVEANQGKAQVTAVLSSLHGNQAISIQYNRIGPPNMLHTGWMKLIEQEGYDPTTNIMGRLKAEKNKDVYLSDMEVVIPTSMFSAYSKEALEQWGTSPKSGYSPDHSANDLNSLSITNIGNLMEHSPIRQEINALQESMKVSFSWFVKANSYVDGQLVSKVTKETGGFYMTLPAVDPGKDYMHVKYVVGGQTKYWMYQLGSGAHPTLDKLLNVPPSLTGTYMPFTYFRYGKAPSNVDKTSEAYKTSNQMLKILGMDYDDVADAITDNPDVADVETAILMFGVPIDSTNKHEQRYLWEFFDNLFANSAEQFNLPIRRDISARQLNRSPNYTRSSIVIQDKKFKMALSHEGIFKTIKVGSIGAIGSFTSSYGIVNTIFNVQDDEYGVVQRNKQTKVHTFKRQLSDTLYEEITVEGFQMLYYVYEEYTTTADETDDIFLIPIDISLTKTWSIPDKEILYSRSMHMVFNSRVVTKIKWYQRGVFKVIMVIVSVVMAYFTMGATLKSLALALSTGTGVGAAVFILIKKLLLGALLAFAFKAFAKVVGIEIAIIFAVVLVAYGVFDALKFGSIQGAPWASDLLKLASGISKGIQDQVASLFKELQVEAASFSEQMAEQLKGLESAQDLLDNSQILSPIVIFGEKPEDFYNRTVHSGNVGVLAFSAVENYVDTALELPRIDQTITFGEKEYEYES